MITWMQKRRKMMLATMWVAVITFIGAGAVDWGGSSYGSKATSLATVGDMEITPKQLNRQYSMMFRQYNQMMGGKLDQEMAKKLGLDDQALKMLIQQALMLNLAQTYEIVIPDSELAVEVQKIESFQKDGVFDKETYTKVLKANNYTTQEFEAGLQRDLTVQKVSSLLQSKISHAEQEPFLTMSAIADKIEYLILESKTIPVTVDDQALQSFWELKKDQFMTQAQISVEEITVKPLHKTFSDDEISEYYTKESYNFTNEKGEIQPLSDVKDKVIAALNDLATKKAANLLYIDWKKGKLSNDITATPRSFQADKSPYSMEVNEKVLALQVGQAMKAVKVGDNYAVIKLIEQIPSRAKTFEEAKAEVRPLYITNQKRQKLQENAAAQLDIFKGKPTPFITKENSDALTELSSGEAKVALNKLFRSNQKSGQIVINDDKIMLYRVAAQKLLLKNKSVNADIDLEKQIETLKEQTRLSALMQALNEKYKTEIYYK